MDIYELRNAIAVTIYAIYKDSAVIRYTKSGKLNSISLSEIELVQELLAIGSINDERVIDLMNNYNLSQWDALNIAIRFELAREQEKELDHSDIFKAIANIINPSNNTQ